MLSKFQKLMKNYLGVNYVKGHTPAVVLAVKMQTNALKVFRNHAKTAKELPVIERWNRLLNHN